MTTLHRARLKARWKDYQKRHKLSQEQMAKKVGCTMTVAKSLLQNRSETLKSPHSKSLIDLLGNYIRLDYQPPNSYRTFVSPTNRFQVSELDLVVKPRPSDFEAEQDKMKAFVQKNQDLFAAYPNYAAATRGCEDIDRKYTAFKQALKASA